MKRRGLSTLELVLALPILLGVMALMINFGTAACWKVRASIIARQKLWESRSGRSSGVNSQPDWWPGTSSTGGGHIDELDDPRVDLPVARGPLLPWAEVNSDLLDPTRGLLTASADLDRAFPMLSSMGSYNLTARSALLDRKFTFSGDLSSSYHGTRRSPMLYVFQKAEAELGQAYVDAVVAILYAPFREALMPLDRDAEFQYYNTLFAPYENTKHVWGGGSPEFHPGLGGFCDMDHAVAKDKVSDLVDRIQGADKDKKHIPSVAERMTRSFIHLYEHILEEIENLENLEPPFPPNQAAALRAQVPQLQQKIDILNQFLLTLTSP